MDHVDLAIIGSGSGNSLITPDFADKQVAVIESGAFGGTCLNVGCIPTKMFVYAAHVAHVARESSRYGVDARVEGVRWPDIRDRVFGRIDPISEGGYEYRRQGENTRTYAGRARFTGPKELAISLNDGGEVALSADQIVVATGSSPVVPKVVAESGVRYHTSDDVMRLAELPESMVILGGGFIAAEFAHVFSDLGVKVTLVVRGPALLRKEDEEVSAAFTRIAGARWDVRLNSPVSAVRQGEGQIEVTLADGSSACGEVLLVATGRAPNSADLDVGAAGLAMRPDGRIVVDEFGRTTVPGVWALGDISSPYQLKHVANHEARVVAHNLTHPQDLRPFDHRAVPSAVFTIPQIASVGATEQQLRERGVPFVSKVQRYGDTAYGWAMEDVESFCKVLADPSSGELLGAHILGVEASTLIQPLIQAMSFGQTVSQVARGQYWIHPALTEVLENALLGVEAARS
ncbi:mycothione reductase [Austwickia chelonae]|uniref:Mycothione reductase n=1 Tax=Austwickia chelonae NBRC 105200 TaxID=1184607 RepID=K6W933_9MICO|nr:mycothione reductase [Austwickia chelonae]GAB78342.1 mycothione reductase [Austwickia chelonae NBRC 105200]SEW01670.1 mycothione reductase [Austwickia chelonae]